MIYDIAIIGAGVIGGMVARELSRYQLYYGAKNDICIKGIKEIIELSHI